MTKLSERVLVDVTLAQGGRRISDYLRDHAKPEGNGYSLTLRLSVPIPGLAKPLTIQKDVLATFAPEPASSDMMPHYRVSWAPREGGPFPVFQGRVTIEGAEDYERFWLVLEGSYEPPIGLIGGAFDALAGRFIARATARDLLGRIRDGVETAYELDEAAKLVPHGAGSSA